MPKKGGEKMKKLALLGIFLIVLILLAISVHLTYGQEEPKVEWVARYDGPANDLDYPNGMAVDQHGNVYITGSSVGIRTSNDWATVKYDANGNELWVQRHHWGGC